MSIPKIPHTDGLSQRKTLHGLAGPAAADALAYLAQGMSVVPLQPGTKISALGKGRIQRYRQHPATREEVERWFADGQHNLGLLTGRASHLLVLDLDGREGRAFLRGKAVPPTPMVETPSDSLHMYFRLPDLLAVPFRCHIRAGGHEGVDLCGNDGYVVAPPSLLTPYTKRHRPYPGSQYTFAEVWDVHHLRADLADPPAWLIDLWRAADRTLAPQVPSAGEVSTEYSVLTSPKDVLLPAMVAKRQGVRAPGLGEVGVAELARDAAAEWTCARFLGLSKSPDDIGKPFHCVLPGHEERQPSASLYRDRHGSVMYRDWHQRSGRSWYMLPEVYASLITGDTAPLPTPSLAVWRIRLWLAAGVLERPTVPIPPIPADVPTSIRRVYEGFRLLVACKWAYKPGTPTTFSWTFAAGWCGVGERQAGEAITWLLRHHILQPAGTYHRARLFLPGTRAR